MGFLCCKCPDRPLKPVCHMCYATAELLSSHSAATTEFGGGVSSLLDSRHRDGVSTGALLCLMPPKLAIVFSMLMQASPVLVAKMFTCYVCQLPLCARV